VKAIIVYGLSFIVFWTGQHTNGHRLLRRTLLHPAQLAAV